VAFSPAAVVPGFLPYWETLEKGTFLHQQMVTVCKTAGKNGGQKRMTSGIERRACPGCLSFQHRYKRALTVENGTNPRKTGTFHHQQTVGKRMVSPVNSRGRRRHRIRNPVFIPCNARELQPLERKMLPALLQSGHEKSIINHVESLTRYL
jgi:hypothetical protein